MARDLRGTDPRAEVVDRPDELTPTFPRRLKVLAIGLPILFIAAILMAQLLEVHYELLAPDDHLAAVAVLGALTGVAAIGFAHFMFRQLERTQARVLRQNRQLTALSSLAVSLQDQFSVDDIVAAGAASILASTGGCDLVVTVYSGAGEDGRDPRRDQHTTFDRSDPTRISPQGRAKARTLDMPLVTGTATVGWMRLRLPAAQQDRAFPEETVRSLAHQLASAIQSAQLLADVERRTAQDRGLFELLLEVTDRHATADILASVVQLARGTLRADEVVLTVNLAWGGDAPGVAGGPFGDGVSCITAGEGSFHDPHGDEVICPVRSSPEWMAATTASIRDETGTVGDLWVARRDAVPFTRHERDYLQAVARLAGIALAQVRMREQEQLTAVLSERERIAREMHDSLAQVLGATHVRLRALDGRVRDAGLATAADDLAAVADDCHEAYRDVREAILGLRSSATGSERGLIPSLRAYLAKYTNLSGIPAVLTTELDDGIAFAPRVEVHMIRVVQEALTNVRKHAAARRVDVRIAIEGSTAVFVVADDGEGFIATDVPAGRDGYGLHTMRERVAILGGQLHVTSVRGQGTTVTAIVPSTALARPRLVDVKDDTVSHAR